MKYKVLIISTLFLVFTTAVMSKTVKTYSGSVLLLPPTAYISSVGNANSALADDINSLFSNPAGLAAVKYKSLVFSHFMNFQNINFEYIGYALPVDKTSANLGIDISLLNSGKIDRTILVSPDPQNPAYKNRGYYRDMERIIGIYYAISFTKSFNIGAGLKHFYSKLDTYSVSNVIYNLGMQKILLDAKHKKVVFSAELRNIGNSVKYNVEEYNLPSSLKLGMGIIFWKNNNRIKTEIDAEYTIQNDFLYDMGVDWLLDDILSIRFGYDSKNNADKGFTCGMGYKVVNESHENSSWEIDYSYIPYGNIGNSHNISFNVKFGPPKKILLRKIKKEIKKVSPITLYEKISLTIITGNIDKAEFLLNQDIKGEKLLSPEQVDLLKNMIDEYRNSDY